MIKFKQGGTLEKTKHFLEGAKTIKQLKTRAAIEKSAIMGVEALRNATPKKTGATASAWSYVIEESDGKIVISWTNDHVVNGVNIAIILQYGHATKSGSRVEGIDYINPALRSVFIKMSDDMWKAVVSL